MSLMDKSVSFDSTNSGLATAIYTIIKPIFKNAILDGSYFTSEFHSKLESDLEETIKNKDYHE